MKYCISDSTNLKYVNLRIFPEKKFFHGINVLYLILSSQKNFVKIEWVTSKRAYTDGFRISNHCSPKWDQSELSTLNSQQDIDGCVMKNVVQKSNFLKQKIIMSHEKFLPAVSSARKWSLKWVGIYGSVLLEFPNTGYIPKFENVAAIYSNK